MFRFVRAPAVAGSLVEKPWHRVAGSNVMEISGSGPCWGDHCVTSSCSPPARVPDSPPWCKVFDGSRFSTFLAGSVPGLESSTTQDLLVDPDGSLWVATLGGGVSHNQQGTFHSYTIHDGLPSDDVQSLYRDTRGRLTSRFRRCATPGPPNSCFARR